MQPKKSSWCCVVCGRNSVDTDMQIRSKRRALDPVDLLTSLYECIFGATSSKINPCHEEIFPMFCLTCSELLQKWRETEVQISTLKEMSRHVKATLVAFIIRADVRGCIESMQEKPSRLRELEEIMTKIRDRIHGEYNVRVRIEKLQEIPLKNLLVHLPAFQRRDQLEILSNTLDLESEEDCYNCDDFYDVPVSGEPTAATPEPGTAKSHDENDKVCLGKYSKAGKKRKQMGSHKRNKGLSRTSADSKEMPLVESTGPGEYLYLNKYPISCDQDTFVYSCGLCGKKSGKRKLIQTIIQHIQDLHMTEEEARNSNSDVCKGESESVEKAESTEEQEGKERTIELQPAEGTMDADDEFKVEQDAQQLCSPEKHSKLHKTSKRESYKLIPTGPGEFLLDNKIPITVVGGDTKCGSCGLFFPSVERATSHATSVHLRQISHIRPTHLRKDVKEVMRNGQKMTFSLEIEPSLWDHGGFRYRLDPQTNRYECLTCGYKYLKKVRMAQHITYYHRNKAEKYICEICGKEFRNRPLLHNHKRRHGPKKHKCDECGKAFAKKDDLQGHQRRHKGDEAKTIVCEFCGKRFYKTNQLENHRTVHTGEEPFQCDLCGIKFANRNRLWAHRKTAHVNVVAPGHNNDPESKVVDLPENEGNDAKEK